MTAARSDLALKPCPFCGSNDISHRYVRDGRQVFCQGCRASAPPTFHGPAGDTIERAIASWNTRPDREAVARIVDPKAFAPVTGDYDWHPDDRVHAQNVALKQADAILSLLSGRHSAPTRECE